MKPLRIRYSVAIILMSALIALFARQLVNIFQISDDAQQYAADVTRDEERDKASNRNYLAAVVAFKTDNYQVAIDELNEEIRKDPAHRQAYFLLARIYEIAEFPGGRYYSRMATNLEKYIEIAPRGKRANHAKLRLAQFYIQGGLNQQKIDLLNKAEALLKTLDQTNGDVRMALGAIYLNAQNYDKAISEFEKSASMAPNDLKLKYNSLGMAYIKKGEYGKAEKTLEIAIKIDPTDRYAHNNLGYIYAQQGYYDKAARQFEHALKLDPSYSNAQKNLEWTHEILDRRKNR